MFYKFDLFFIEHKNFADRLLEFNSSSIRISSNRHQSNPCLTFGFSKSATTIIGNTPLLLAGADGKARRGVCLRGQ